MPVQSPAYRRHLENLQNEADAKKFREMQKLDLYNEKTFYPAFVKDLSHAQKEVIIYCPFITKYRSEFFCKTFQYLRKRNISVFIFTRPIEEHDYFARAEIKCALKDYEETGVTIIYLSGQIHEKAAIIDRRILWEGSLNILSQRDSKEMMKRTDDEESVIQIMTFLDIRLKLAEGYKLQYEQLYRSLVENLNTKKRFIKFAMKIFKAFGVLVHRAIKS
jgi:phosphatidylserine/phosphatidylglycerophosphate/cardiolipin synthase-like enzyme